MEVKNIVDILFYTRRSGGVLTMTPISPIIPISPGGPLSPYKIK